jgi:murein L,D-transpeptidase YafK
MHKYIATLVFILLSNGNLLATDFLPESIYQLDSRFSHHVLLVEKSTHTLYLYENNNQAPKLIKTYKIATGKRTGNKSVQGDKKTPEGIYFFKKFRSGENLVKSYGKTGLIYGAGAFTMNYPNFIDKKEGKTGGGIWLHSTDDDNRISKGLDSKGCVVATDKDIKDISKYIDIKNTPIIVTQNLHFLTKESWLRNKNEISKVIINWAKAWKAKDFPNYISQYSKTDFESESKGNYYSFKNYKKRIFRKPGNPNITFKNISILSFKQYAVVTLEQEYKSQIINDIGKKTIFMKRDANYKWKIINESWKKIDQSRGEFSPSSRYFASDNDASAEELE